MASNHNNRLERNYSFDLKKVGLNEEMDVMHHFIKNLFLTKARLSKIEIFEQPAHAVLTLTEHSSSSAKHQNETSSPTHIVKLWVHKKKNQYDDFQIKCGIESCAPAPRKPNLLQRALPWTSPA